MSCWRFLLALCALFLVAGPTQATEICELDAADIPPTCIDLDAYGVFPTVPEGQCPEGSRPVLICGPQLPPAQIRCRGEGNATECFASPNGLNINLYYTWTSQQINLWAEGPDAWFSCDRDVSAVISVLISDDIGRTTFAQKLVSCRKPRTGVQPR